jgi:hypothetical protein
MTTIAQDSSDVDCLTKPVRPVLHTSQAKTTASEPQERKCHRPDEESTSKTSSLYSKSHGKCLMAEEKKKSRKSESEFEEEEDLDLDNPSKKDMIKIKKLFERIQE